jgi:hypothetical protein
VALWASAGLSAQLRAALETVEYRVGELPGTLLALATPGIIWLDRDAAGYGWFVDATPADRAEFHSDASPAVDHIDLLTVLAHELGHLIGLAHPNEPDPTDELMSDILPPSTRRTPDPHAIDHVLAQP